MKIIIKKVLKSILIFIISTIIIYLIFTISAFYNWSVENQIFIKSDTLLLELKSEKIQKLGDYVGNYAKLLEESKNKTYDEESSNYHSLGEYYNPLGFAVWQYFSIEIREIWNKYITISILSGISIVIAYIIISSKKMNNILKFVLGYFGVMLIIPLIYMYILTNNFWGILPTYQSMPKYFYIGYTTLFILMYFINYKIGVKMTKELNKNIKSLESK